jgi:hypothetical protein
MPSNLRAIIAEAERRFPLRIIVRVPGSGIGSRYKPMTDWLDENCGINGWATAAAGTRGVMNDAIAVYVSNPTCAVAFVRAGSSPAIHRASTSCAATNRRGGCPSRRTDVRLFASSWVKLVTSKLKTAPAA